MSTPEVSLMYYCRKLGIRGDKLMSGQHIFILCLQIGEHSPSFVAVLCQESPWSSVENGEQ